MNPNDIDAIRDLYAESVEVDPDEVDGQAVTRALGTCLGIIDRLSSESASQSDELVERAGEIKRLRRVFRRILGDDELTWAELEHLIVDELAKWEEL